MRCFGFYIEEYFYLKFSINFCFDCFKLIYTFIIRTEIIIKLDSLNPQIAARFASIFNHWRRFTEQYSSLQENELKIISNSTELSNDVFEIVNTSLKGKI